VDRLDQPIRRESLALLPPLKHEALWRDDSMTERTTNRTATDRLKTMLDTCQICDIPLVEAIKERVDNGESVSSVCKELEDYQIDQHGAAAFSASALRKRYQRINGTAGTNVPTNRVARNRQSNSDPEIYQIRELLVDIDADKLNAAVEWIGSFPEDHRWLFTPRKYPRSKDRLSQFETLLDAAGIILRLKEQLMAY